MSDEPTEKPKPDTFKQHYAGTNIAKRQIQEHDSVEKQHKPNKPNREPTPMEAIMKAWDFIRDTSNSQAIIAIFTVGIFVSGLVYGVVSLLQWDAANKSVDVARKSLNAGQQAHVTVGRNDGVVAELVMPKAADGNAGILVYFQNSGHLPAKFNWGTWGTSWGTARIPGGATTIIESDRRFTPLWAGTDRKSGGILALGGVDIAGDSLYASTIIERPVKEMTQWLRESDPAVQFAGIFDYCDNLGNYSCRTFHIGYLREPYNRFVLMAEDECPAFATELLNPNPDLDYFPPCEAAAREREMEERMRRMTPPTTH